MKGFLIFLTIVSCAAGLTRPARAFTFQDTEGRRVEICAPPQRVVFLSLYELIPVFGIWDRAVGINRWAYDSEILKSFARTREIPSVGTAESVNVEALLSLHPDLVITWSFKPEVGAFLTARGLKVISVYPESLDQLYAIIDLYGTLFGKEARAREIREEMERSFAETASKVSDIPPEKRRKVLWLWQKPTTVTGGIGLQEGLIRLICAVNPAEGINAKYQDVSMEWIVAWNPDVIFIWGNARYGPEDLAAKPQWKALKAVREGRVYKAPALSSWSPAIAGMALWMACKTYPERFDRTDVRNRILQFHKKCFGIPMEGFSLE